MKLSEVIALIGAGYTKAEIEAMEKGDAGKETPKQVDEPKPEAEAKPEPKPETPKADNSELLDAIKSLTAAVQQKNVRNSTQPIETDTDIKKEADKVLLNLYNN